MVVTLVVTVVVVLAAAAAISYGVRPSEVESSWRLVRSNPGSNVILIEAVIGNSCNEFKRIDVDEEPDRVTISVRSHGPRRWLPEGCNDLAQIECHTVELARPLGRRTIRGGAPGLAESRESCGGK